ncbi:MAG: hypothetical protein Q9168_006949 [Polycauliona sp. 1 TL-2023]
MAGVKRASNGEASAAKRLCLSKQPEKIMSKEDLEAMDKHDLILFILDLQARNLSTAATPPSPPATPGLSEEETQRKAGKARDMMEKGIKSQMKWKPSCKTSGARFSYAGVVASPQIFLKLFRLDADWEKKQLQFTPDEFQHTTGTDISASIRYGSLSVVGKKVTVRWDADELTFTVTGLYGLYGL